MTSKIVLQNNGRKVDLIGTVATPTGFSDPSQTTARITGAIQVILAIAAVASVIMIMINGIKISVSAGDPQKAKAGREGIQYALIGLVIVFVAYILLELVGTALGVSDFNFGVLNGS